MCSCHHKHPMTPNNNLSPMNSKQSKDSSEERFERWWDNHAYLNQDDARSIFEEVDTYYVPNLKRLTEENAALKVQTEELRKRLEEAEEVCLIQNNSIQMLKTLFRRQSTAPACKVDQYEPDSLVDFQAEEALKALSAYRSTASIKTDETDKE